VEHKIVVNVNNNKSVRYFRGCLTIAYNDRAWRCRGI
jgi:hypothetical protein